MESLRKAPGLPHQWHPLIWPLLGAKVIAMLDEAVKLAVLTLRPQTSVIPGFFDLRFGTNTGVAFGLFQGFPLGVTILGSVLSMAILIYLTRVAHVAPALERTGLALIMGGATGNLVDRMRLGYVVDYLDFYLAQYHWPALNLADSRSASVPAASPSAGFAGAPRRRDPLE